MLLSGVAQIYCLRHLHFIRTRITIALLSAFTRFFCIILLSTACGGCRSDAAKAPAAPRSSLDPLQDIQPIADADPSRRHPVATPVPTGFDLVRREETLIYRFTELQTTNLMVGFKMVTGVKYEGSMHCDGTVCSLFRLLVGSHRLMSAPDLDTSTRTFKLDREKGFAQSGEGCIFEYRVTIFETDLPSQHMWSPQSGKHYKVLWTRTFKETIR